MESKQVRNKSIDFAGENCGVPMPQIEIKNFDAEHEEAKDKIEIINDTNSEPKKDINDTLPLDIKQDIVMEISVIDQLNNEEEDEIDQYEILKEIQFVVDDNESKLINNENFQKLRDGFISLDCGINSVCIPINKDDVGSLIAYSLSANCYYEGLARQNYMEFQSKIDQNSCEDISKMTNAIPNINIPKEFADKKACTLNQIQGLQNQLYNIKSSIDPKNKQRILLNDKTDVLDSEYQPHHIESEFLSYEKINFKLKWSTSRRDMKMKVFKNIFKVDNIHGHIQEYLHKNKNVDEIVLPGYSKNFLEDDNITKIFTDIGEIKRIHELRSSQIRVRQRENKNDSQIMDNSVIMNPLFNQSHMGGDLGLVSKPSTAFTEVPNNVLSFGNMSIPDLSISPSQPPVHQLTDKYKVKKVVSLLGEENLDFEVTIYFPKKFEALRKFYCGSHEDFIKSIMRSKEWADNSGGKQKGRFFKSGDEKYIFKEIKTGDIRMFTEFAPRYFDYLCKSFFHNFPCALAKILGAFKISIRPYGSKSKMTEKYYVITENLNYGITNEKSIVRYDLKGSTRNRYIKVDDGEKQTGCQAKVLLDTNFMLDNKSRPMVESKFKAIIAAGDVPTIVDPTPYKTRFQEAIRKYFITTS